MLGKYDIMTVLVPSSSGLGRLVLIQKIAGSTPAGITKVTNKKKEFTLSFLSNRR